VSFCLSATWAQDHSITLYELTKVDGADALDALRELGLAGQLPLKNNKQRA
jgi:hypothetical protein